jgi:DNA-binding CsgD family transcriptional regulator
VAGHASSLSVSEDDVTRCLDKLSPAARHLVEVGAVFGPSFAMADLAEVVGQPAGGLVAVVQEAVDVSVLVPGPEALDFSQDVFRQVTYEAVPGAVRLALHRQIGELLLQRRAWEPAAHHLMQGVTVRDRVAAAGLEQVAREIRTSTPEWASELALRALALTDPGDADRFARAATAVETLMSAGRLGEARYLGRRALGSHGVSAPAAARLRLALAEMELVAGRPQAAIDEIQFVLSDPAVPTPFHAPAEVWLLWAKLALDDLAGGRRQLEQILSGGAGRDEFLPAALTALAILTWRDGRAADALALTRAAVAQSDRRQPPGTVVPMRRLYLAWMLTALGELDEAAGLVDAASDEIAASGRTLWSAAPMVVASRVHLAAGRLGDAAASARSAVELATRLGTPWFLPMARALLAEVAVMRGELREAASQLERNGPVIAWPPWGAGACRLAAARLTEAEGRPDRALVQAADLYDDEGLDARLLLDDPGGAAWFVRTALAAGDRERAGRVAAHVERLGLANAAFPAVVAVSRHVHGLLRRDAGLLREASQLYRHAGARASAWEDAGVAVRGDDRSAARDLLERAVAAYEVQGAERDAARVRSRLREIGVRWRHGRRAERPVSGWGSLTDTEREVAELVAEGLTNARVAERMYLSRHTVDFYLRQIFQKLGIDSRVTLARAHLERDRRSNAKDYASV